MVVINDSIDPSEKHNITAENKIAETSAATNSINVLMIASPKKIKSKLFVKGNAFIVPVFKNAYKTIT